MPSDLFESYRQHGCQAERTYRNALLLAIQACADPARPDALVFGKQLFLVVTSALEPEARSPRGWQEAVDELVAAEALTVHGDHSDEFRITEQGLQLSREEFGVLPQLWRPVCRGEFDVWAYSRPEGLSWQYEKGILLRVHHQEMTYAYPRRARRELGDTWLTFMPPSHEDNWNAVDELESTVGRFEPVPADAWNP